MEIPGNLTNDKKWAQGKHNKAKIILNVYLKRTQIPKKQGYK